MKKLGQVMLYVEDTTATMIFWTEKLGFKLLETLAFTPEINSYILGGSADDQATICLHDKQVASQMSLELDLGTPSLVFYCDNLDEIHASYQKNGVTVGDIAQFPHGRSFNFADNENRYFAYLEK